MNVTCKICGGIIQVDIGTTFAECAYCGNLNTIPLVNTSDELVLYRKANRLRSQCDFDKAVVLYEQLLTDNPKDAEAHWGKSLCRFGVEYIKDTVTDRMLPTCHRITGSSIMDDPDYLAAVEYAPDASSRQVYQLQAKEIDRIQKIIKTIMAKEKPYDVFISYKDKDDNNQERTKASVKAQAIYHELEKLGYHVFFSRITLADKTGEMYEPHIFYALNTAKVMLVIGTKADEFKASWVKNEYSRFLERLKKEDNIYLIPCYMDMEPYDLPIELKDFQSMDMDRIAFMPDLMETLRRIINRQGPSFNYNKRETQVVNEQKQNQDHPLLRRAFIYLEDGDFEKADEYLEQVLDIEPENGKAYLGKLMVERKLKTPSQLVDSEKPLTDSIYYNKIIKYSDSQLSSQMEKYANTVDERNRKRKVLDQIYNRADQLLLNAETIPDYETILQLVSPYLSEKRAKGIYDSCIREIDCIKRYKGWELQAQEVRKYYPTFLFYNEMLNYGFSGLLKQGKTVLEAFETIHRNDIIKNQIITQKNIDDLRNDSYKVIVYSDNSIQFVNRVKQLLKITDYNTSESFYNISKDLDGDFKYEDSVKTRDEVYSKIYEIIKVLVNRLSSNKNYQLAQMIGSELLDDFKKNNQIYENILNGLSVANNKVRSQKKQADQKAKKKWDTIKTVIIVLVFIALGIAGSNQKRNNQNRGNSAYTSASNPAPVTISNGNMLIKPDYDQICPLEIKGDTSHNYYIYLKYEGAPKKSEETRKLRSSAQAPYEADIAFYLSAGKSVKINVPIGRYRFYYATGNTFYGTKMLFGTDTMYYSSDELLEFYADSDHYTGHTITLKTTTGGNFDTDPVAENIFPLR